MNIETLGTFLGWCMVLNIGILLFVGIFWILFKDPFAKIVASRFGITVEEAKVTIFRVFMQYRIAIIVLNFVPYIALMIMA